MHVIETELILNHRDVMDFFHERLAMFSNIEYILYCKTSPPTPLFTAI